VKKPGENRPVGRPWFKRDYNINVGLKDMGWEGRDWPVVMWLTIWTGGEML
jgi:hypothetical protein